MGSNFESQLSRVIANQLVNSVRGDCFFAAAPSGVSQRAEESALGGPTVAGFLKVFLDQVPSHPVKGNVTRLFALPGDSKVPHATALMCEVQNRKLAQFFAPESVIEQGGQDRAVPDPLQRLLRRSDQQLASLMLGK